MAAALVKSLFGLIESVHDMLGNYLKRQRKNFEYKENYDKNRYNYVQRQSGVQRSQIVNNYPNPDSARR